MENSTENVLESVNLGNVKSETPICPILSLKAGSDLHECEGSNCAMWRHRAYNFPLGSCGLVPEPTDLETVELNIADLAVAMQAVAREIHRKPV